MTSYAKSAMPSTDLKLQDVIDTIGKYNTGTLAQQWMAPNINKWSKWKPVTYSGVTITDSILKLKNYGFDMDSILPDDISNVENLNSYNYYRSPESPKRLGDFRNYKHSAQAPYDSTKVTATSTLNVSDDTESYDMNIPYSESGVTKAELGLFEVFGELELQEAKFGLVFHRADWNHLFICELIRNSDGTWNHKIHLSNSLFRTILFNDIYRVFPVVIVNGRIFSLPDNKYFTCEVTGASPDTFKNVCVLRTGYVTILVPKTKPAGVGSANLYLRHSGHSKNESIVRGEANIIGAYFDVDPVTGGEINGLFKNISDYADYSDYRVYVDITFSDKTVYSYSFVPDTSV